MTREEELEDLARRLHGFMTVLLRALDIEPGTVALKMTLSTDQGERQIIVPLGDTMERAERLVGGAPHVRH